MRHEAFLASADHLVLVDGIKDVHLMHERGLAPHTTADGVRLSDGALVYDFGVPSPLAP